MRLAGNRGNMREFLGNYNYLKHYWPLNGTYLDLVGGNHLRQSTGELITNGSFTAWTGDDPDGWTITGEDATHYVTEVVGGARYYSETASPLLSMGQTILVVGKKYRVQVTYTKASSSEMQISGFNGTTIAITSGGWDSLAQGITLTATTTTFLLSRSGNGADNTISYVSVTEIDTAVEAPGVIQGTRGTYFDGTSAELESTSTIDISDTNQVAIAFWMMTPLYNLTGVSYFMQFSEGYTSYTDSFGCGIAGSVAGDPIQTFLKGNIGSSATEYTLATTGIKNYIPYHLTFIFDKSAAALETKLLINGKYQTPSSILFNSNNTNNFGNRTFYFSSANGISQYMNWTVSDLAMFNYLPNDFYKLIDEYYNWSKGSPMKSYITVPLNLNNAATALDDFTANQALTRLLVNNYE